MHFNIGEKHIFSYTGSRQHQESFKSVVFVHGTGMDHTVWLLPARFFAHHQYNVLAVDLPEHGQSSGPPALTIEEMSDEVIFAMDAARIETASLVGHSMGSLVTLALAARYPDRVRSLSLIGTAVPMAVHKSLLNNAAQNDHAAIDMLTYWGYSKAAQLGGNENPGIWMVGATMRLLEKAKTNVIYNDLRACEQYTDGRNHAEKIQCPTLFILGKKDIMTPSEIGKEMAQIITNSRIELLKGTGHSLMSEQPNDVLDALITIV